MNKGKRNFKNKVDWSVSPPADEGNWKLDLNLMLKCTKIHNAWGQLDLRFKLQAKFVSGFLYFCTHYINSAFNLTDMCTGNIQYHAKQPNVC